MLFDRTTEEQFPGLFREKRFLQFADCPCLFKNSSHFLRIAPRAPGHGPYPPIQFRVRDRELFPPGQSQQQSLGTGLPLRLSTAFLFHAGKNFPSFAFRQTAFPQKTIGLLLPSAQSATDQRLRNRKILSLEQKIQELPFHLRTNGRKTFFHGLDDTLIARLCPHDAELLAAIAPQRKQLSLLPDVLESAPKDRGQRPACGCIPSRDIGAYGTCPHLCVYCYANKSEAEVRRNMKLCLSLPEDREFLLDSPPPAPPPLS